MAPTPARPTPAWYAAADAWFKTLGAVALAYLILQQIAALVRNFSDVATILVGGILVAYLVYPAVRRLNERFPLWVALTIVYVSGAIVAALAGWLLLPPALSQLHGLIVELPHITQAVSATLSRPDAPLVRDLPIPLRDYVLKLPGQFSDALLGNLSLWTSRLFGLVFSAVALLAVLIAIPIVSIYMLAETPQIRALFAQTIARRYRGPVYDTLEELEHTIGGFVRGQLVVAGCVALLTIAALLLLHVPYAVLIGLWAGLSDIVPYVGPFAGGIPALLAAYFTNGWQNALLVLVAFVAINQLEAHVLGPRIVARTVHVTPLTVIFALLVGGHAFGFIGLLIAVPLAGAIRVILARVLPTRPVSDEELQRALTYESHAKLESERSST